MRSTNHVVIAVKEQAPTTTRELELALLVEAACGHFLAQTVRRLCEAARGGETGRALAANAAERMLESVFAAQKSDPERWLGRGDLPESPEFRARYALGLRLLGKFLAEKPDAYALLPGSRLVLGKRSWELVERMREHPHRMAWRETTQQEHDPLVRTFYPSEVQALIDSGATVEQAGEQRV